MDAVRLNKAIRRVCGVSIEDMRSSKRSVDRLYGRAIYTHLSGKNRAEVARDLNKCYTTITYYRNAYKALFEGDELFRDKVQQVKDLI